MKVHEVKEKLQDMIDKLDELVDDQEIELRSNTYQIADGGDFFVGFVGSHGGYLSIGDLVSNKDHGDIFEDKDDLIDTLYYEHLEDYFPTIEKEVITVILDNLFSGMDLESLEEMFYYSDQVSINIDNLIDDIESALE